MQRTVLARGSDNLDTATLLWSIVNAKSCRFYGAFIPIEGSAENITPVCQAIVPVTVNQSDCLILGKG